MAIFTIEQAPGDRLVQVLEPVHADNRRFCHCLLEELAVGRTTRLFIGHLSNTAPERATVTGAEVELGNHHRFVQLAQFGEVITVLRLQGVEVEAQYIAVFGTGGHGLRGTDGKAPAQQQVVGRMPLQRVGNGLEVGIGEDFLEVLVIRFDFRVLGVGQRPFETRVFHQFPRRDFNTPGLGQALLVAILVAQLLEKGTLGRYIGGHAQSAQGQRIARFCIITGAGPGQFVVGKVTNQPGIIAVVAGGNGHGTLGSHGKARIKRVGHATPPVGACADAGVVTDNRQRQGVRHAVIEAQFGVAPVADGIEAPGLQTVQGTGLPTLGIKGLRRTRAGRLSGRPGWRIGTGFAVNPLQVGAIEVIPAPGIKATPLGRGIAAVVVRLAVITGQRGAVMGQIGEHPFAASHIGLAVIGRHGIQAQGVERVAFGGNQVPAAIALFRAEKPGRLEPGTLEPAAVLVLVRTPGQPALELLLFFGGRGLELFVIGNTLRPPGAGRLAIAVDDRTVHSLDDTFTVLHAKALQQNALRSIRLRYRQAHRDHLAQVDFTLAAGQQDALAIKRHRHRWPGAHALAVGRVGFQWQQQGLRRAGRQVDPAGQGFAVAALHGHIERQRPVHGVLNTQGHHPRLRPVPHPGLRRQAQAGRSRRVEGDATQHFAFGRLLRIVLRQARIRGRHLHHIGGANEIEQGLLASRRRQQRSRDQQRKNSRQRTANHMDLVLPNGRKTACEVVKVKA